MSTLDTQPKAATTARATGRTRALLSTLNLYWTGLGLLGLLNLVLLVQIGLAWRAASSQNAEALAQQQVALQAAEIAARPLQGLDGKLKLASTEADRFSLERLPVSYSQVLAQLGTLSKRDNVRLTRVGYGQSAVEGDAAGQLTQVSMDASLSGDYRGLVHFINDLERDRVFFLISGVTLTGQQTGQVNLRLRLTTYLRGLAPGEVEQKYQAPVIELPEDGAATVEKTPLLTPAGKVAR